MAKLDTYISKIEGYKEMSVEDKVKALESLVIDDGSAEIKRLNDELEKSKNAVTKANSEAADWKRKHHDLLDDEAKKKSEDDEYVKGLESRLAELEANEKKATLKAGFIANGFSAELADEAAEAFAGGDSSKLFDVQKRFIEEHDKAYKSTLMNGTPAPVGSQGASGTPDYRKLAAEAQSKNDNLKAAYYMRLANESEGNKNQS